MPVPYQVRHLISADGVFQAHVIKQSGYLLDFGDTAIPAAPQR
jgi:hypothetical protein